MIQSRDTNYQIYQKLPYAVIKRIFGLHGCKVWTVLFKNCESLGIRKLFGGITKDKVQAFFLQITHKQAIGAEFVETVF